LARNIDRRGESAKGGEPAQVTAAIRLVTVSYATARLYDSFRFHEIALVAAVALLGRSSANAQPSGGTENFRASNTSLTSPVAANLVITNLAGRDVDLHDGEGQSWFGF